MKQPSSQGVVKSTFVLLFMEARSSNDGGCGKINGGGVMRMVNRGWMVDTKKRYLDCVAEVRN